VKLSRHCSMDVAKMPRLQSGFWPFQQAAF